MTRMDEAAKRRLVGAAVLVALAVIFVPMLVDQGDDDLGDPIVIPDAPKAAGGADDDAHSSVAAAGSDQPLPEPNDLLLPLPTPEPPPSASSAESVSAEARTQSTASSAKPNSDQIGAPNSTTRGDTGREEAAALAAAGPNPLPPGTRAWVIQVASLGSPEAARSLQDDLRTKGYPAFVEQADVAGRRYYRVRVGPETERARADRLAKELATATGGQPLVQRYP